MLKIERLSVSAGSKKVLSDINLEIGKGETRCLFGPNASGKSTLVKAIIGMPEYKIVSGSIFFEGKDITKSGMDERSRLGIASAFQFPPAIKGVTLRTVLEESDRSGMTADEILSRARLDQSFLDRDIGANMSGGEKKRVELAQIFAMKPKLIILDEVETGIDVESLDIIGRELKRFISENNCAVLVITHYGHFLKYLEPKDAYVMIGGNLACSGEAGEILQSIEKKGYGWCRECWKKRRKK